MDERLKRIRESERKSHIEIYTDEKLYATDSWLKKPIKTVREQNADTLEVVDAQFEVNLPTEKMRGYLNEVFAGWKVLKTTVSAQEYDIPREGFISHLRTNVVTFVAGKEMV